MNMKILIVVFFIILKAANRFNAENIKIAM